MNIRCVRLAVTAYLSPWRRAASRFQAAHSRINLPEAQNARLWSGKQINTLSIHKNRIFFAALYRPQRGCCRSDARESSTATLGNRMASFRPLQASAGRPGDAALPTGTFPRGTSHLLATPSSRVSCRAERGSICIPRAQSSGTVVSNDAPEDLRTQTLERPAESLAQPRCGSSCCMTWQP